MFGPAAHADHVISFHACEDPDASPTPTPTGPQPSGSPSPRACVPDQGSRLTGVVNLSFEVAADSPRPIEIEKVELYIIAEDDIPSPNDRSAIETWEFPENRTFTYSWDTTTLTPYNGSYKVQVYAFTTADHPHSASDPSCSGKRCVKERTNLRVDNPPKTPAAPRIVAKTDTTVSVEWDKAPELDVKAYKLYRASTDKADKPPAYGAFKEVASVATTSVRDEVKGEGVYWYTLIVNRHSVVEPDNKGISSAPSPISKAAEVTPAPDDDDDGDAPGAAAPAFQPRVVSRLPRLTASSANLRPPPVPDAPFSAILPYDLPEGAETVPEEDPGVGDPRGPVLPVAVGAFLVSSALALGRMPY